ncbi:GTP-binding protein RAD-like [Babylonia areolata]|uniref:GTP-binding protein RAD-like n=1 Tax=Babylonia areolata TaxID=304850 RepID=UPI003FCF9A9F
MEILDSPLNANIDVLRPDAFVVMYSVSDRKSYETAKEVTRHLRCELGTDRTVLLVANKTDLKRQQRVPAKEAKDTAEVYDCVFVETSAALRLNVDRLLGKLLREITLQLLPEAVPQDGPSE